MKKILMLVMVALLGAACAGKPQIPTIERIPFPEKEYKALPKEGTAVVTGRAYLITEDGFTRYPETEMVRLNPKTTYSQQWFEVNYIGQVDADGNKVRSNIGESDARYDTYIRKAHVDSLGNFEFEKVPEGTYYLSAPIFWIKEVKLEDGGTMMTTLGEFICYEITVKKGEVFVKDITNDVKEPFSEN